MSTGDLRKAVVARVRESGLAKLAAILQDPNIAQRSLSPLQLQRSHETALGDLESSCATMRKPGVVMSEEELQALADIRGACVQVKDRFCHDLENHTCFIFLVTFALIVHTSICALGPHRRLHQRE
jgi:hypothetical protein